VYCNENRLTAHTLVQLQGTESLRKTQGTNREAFFSIAPANVSCLDNVNSNKVTKFDLDHGLECWTCVRKVIGLNLG
jgi:hypothetical protein